MNVFEAVKQSVTMRQAAQMYRIKVSRNGMACCPFHQDKHPSMKLYKQRFHCFGCQADGDVIDFTSRLFGLSVKEAAEKLAADFGISYENRSRASPRPARKIVSVEQRYQQAEQKCFRVFSDYLRLLEQWRTEYAPEPEDEKWHPLFAESLEKQTHVEYLLDTLLSGSFEDRAALVAAQGEEVMKIERRISEFAAGDPAGRGERDAVAFTGTDGR